MFFRIVTWCFLIAIVILTVTPPLGVVSGAPHNVEHAIVFLATGIAVGLGYELRMSIACAAAVMFCAGLEVVQLAVQGRHARVSDFFVNAGAACFGIAIIWTVRRLRERNRGRKRSGVL